MSSLPKSTRRLAATLGMLAEASGRIAQEYRDIAAAQKGEVQEFAIVIYLRVVSSERERLKKSLTSLAERGGIKPPAGHDVQIGCPPGSAWFFAQVSASDAAAATQIVLRLFREGLIDAGVEPGNMIFEVEAMSALERQ